MVDIVSSSIVEQANPLTTRCQDAYSGDRTKRLRIFMFFHKLPKKQKLSSNDMFLQRFSCILFLSLAVAPVTVISHAAADPVRVAESPTMGNANPLLGQPFQRNDWANLPESTDNQTSLSPGNPAITDERYRSPLEKLQQPTTTSPWFMNILHGVVTEYDRTHHAPHPLTPPNRDDR
ncbi:MAG: hypothetical protein HQL77_12915 [Magnetococcales bacterium]|nr:hypothetical protein [Magnetococcales bacterium]